MKLRNIKKNTINAALNNTSYALNVSIKLKRELTDNDLIELTNDHCNDENQYTKQYNMFIDGIWFPLIDAQPKLIDTFSYDITKPIAQSPFEISVFATQEPVRQNTLIDLFNPIYQKLKNMDVIDQVKVTVIQYNVTTCEEVALFELE